MEMPRGTEVLSGGAIEGRISRPQSALEQLYQNFCVNTREAGSLPLKHHQSACYKRWYEFIVRLAIEPAPGCAGSYRAG